METNNKNKKIEELTDEQLKQVAGGRELTVPCYRGLASLGCQNYDVKQCKCLD